MSSHLPNPIASFLPPTTSYATHLHNNLLRGSIFISILLAFLDKSTVPSLTKFVLLVWTPLGPLLPCCLVVVHNDH